MRRARVSVSSSVSIPHRYAKNYDELGSTVVALGFQFLIGTLKTAQRHGQRT